MLKLIAVNVTCMIDPCCTPPSAVLVPRCWFPAPTQALQQRESQLCRENETLQQQVGSYKHSLNKAAVQQEELTKQLHKESSQRKQAETDLRKLHKEREYLKMRVDRMQHALSILESVMDDTLRVSQNAGGDFKGATTSAILRQSMDAASVQQLQAMIRSSKAISSDAVLKTDQQ
jgi:septal ring factor EnvC (AmiA/AmiB activator)